MHTVFYGSPGTGKTTVARVYGQILKALGLLSKGHVVETDRAGLVANYIGQTANKTDEKVREALGGVLFIDEAYSLYTGDESKWDYGAEAIQVLVKRMEDYREDLVVIVAGYPEPMNEFLDSNEGFKSRFPRYLHFDDYLPEQLLEILRKFCREGDNKLEPAATEKVTEVIQQACDKRGKSFGNARYVRNIYEKMVRHRATRLAQSGKFTDYALQHFDPADVEPLLESKRIEDSVGGDERPIGFRRSRD
jgi:SpoVK/Ycf46/Vps4 family AAA+-type ATPase